MDLNRNFPDAFTGSNASIQPETRAVMDWINSEMFVLSANLHGGAVVASYPFDNGNAGKLMLILTVSGTWGITLLGRPKK